MQGRGERINNRKRKIAALSLAFLALARLAAAVEESWGGSPRMIEVPQGGIAAVPISGPDFEEISGRLGDRKILFFRGDEGIWSALVGIDLEESPRTVPMTIQGWRRDGSEKRAVVTLRIQRRNFPTERISVAPSFDHLDEGVLKRIEKERRRLDGLWRAVPGPRLWKEPFLSPLPLEISSQFGFRRIVNGIPRAPHSGVDLRAPEGTEVKAANDGTVALRDELFFNGRSLVLDHGGGLYTMYFHLADYRVEEGAPVRRGEVIGLSGMTGRVTGPHLHWGARLDGARVDPLALPGIPTRAE